jgi:hypothetical protein
MIAILGLPCLSPDNSSLDSQRRVPCVMSYIVPRTPLGLLNEKNVGVGPQGSLCSTSVCLRNAVWHPQVQNVYIQKFVSVFKR